MGSRSLIWPVFFVCVGFLGIPAISGSEPSRDLALKIPDRHPYLLLTARDVQRLRESAARDAEARKIVSRIVQSAHAAAGKPLGPLPGQGDNSHRRIGARLARVGLGYALSGDKAMAAWVRDGLAAYADLYQSLRPVKEGRCRLFPTSLMEATWACKMAVAYDLTLDSGLFSDAQRRHVEEDLLRAIPPCLVITDYERDPRMSDLHFRCYNFQAWHIAAVGQIGLVLRDPKLVDWAVNSRYGFKHLLAHDIRDDGLFWERSGGYHQYVLLAVVPLLEALRHCGADLYQLSMPSDPSIEGFHYPTDSSAAPKGLRMMFQAPLYSAFPDLTYAALGDDGSGSVRADDGTLVAWNRYHDPHLAWLLRREPQRKSWRWLVNDAPSRDAAQVAAETESVWRDQPVGNSGVFRNGCTLLPASGLAVLREKAGDFTADPQATAVALSCGPYGGGHGHPDKLSMVVYALGRQWTPMLGTMPYETHWKKEWTSHTISANTVIIDGISQRPVGEKSRMWPSDDGKDRVHGALEQFDPWAKSVVGRCNSAYPGFALLRNVRLWRHCVVDRFTVSPSAEEKTSAAGTHRFDYVLHVNGAVTAPADVMKPRTHSLGDKCGYQFVRQIQAGTVERPTPLELTAGKERMRLWVLPQAGSLEIILAEGFAGPTKRSFVASPDVKGPMILLRQHGESATFQTVFEPLGRAAELNPQTLERDLGIRGTAR